MDQADIKVRSQAFYVFVHAGTVTVSLMICLLSAQLNCYFTVIFPVPCLLTSPAMWFPKLEYFHHCPLLFDVWIKRIQQIIFRHSEWGKKWVFFSGESCSLRIFLGICIHSKAYITSAVWIHHYLDRDRPLIFSLWSPVLLDEMTAVVNIFISCSELVNLRAAAWVGRKYCF